MTMSSHAVPEQTGAPGRAAERSASATVRIGTRGSALALAQARLVAVALDRAGVPTAMVVIETEGDRRAPDTAWGEGAFVSALELALREGRVDVAVHSAKDIPTDHEDGLVLAAFLPRADPRDALVLRKGDPTRTLADLPGGARVGTDSPRRSGFILARRPDLVLHPLHGNVDTRLRRLDDGETDALVLAVAGLSRLGLEDRIVEALDPAVVPPAPGQGAIGIQARAEDTPLLALLASIDDVPTRAAVVAERAFLRAAGGGCRAPIGALALLSGDAITLLGGFAETDGRDAAVETVSGPAGDAPLLAADLAARLARAVPGARVAEEQQLERPRRARVLVTRAAGQAESLASGLTAAGFDPLVVPTIATREAEPGGDLDAAVSTGADDWIVVTSPNGASATLAALTRAGLEPSGRRWAAVGAATAVVLEEAGVRDVWRPSESTGVRIADELPIETGSRLLLARTSIATTELPDRLRERGADVREVVAYETIEGPAEFRAALRAALAGGVPHAVVFASGSAARGLLALAGPDLDETCRSIPAICIGETTATVAAGLGFGVVAIAPSPSIGELVSLVRGAVATHPSPPAAVSPARTTPTSIPAGVGTSIPGSDPSQRNAR